jgi:succinoglycan biosynthesis protein ExoA
VTVGVVIPCRNEARWVSELLGALLAQSRRPDEVVVVDDGSSDRTAAVVDEWRTRHEGLPIRVTRGPGRGIAAAVNAGVAALATDVILRLDGHCYPHREYIAHAVSWLAQPDVGVVGGVWIIEPGAATRMADAIAVAAAHRLGTGGALYRGGHVLHAVDVDTVPFGCFTRALWKSLGGLDERLRSNEDYDFNYRVRQASLRVVLDPRIRCTYYARPTITAVAQQYGRYGWWKARMLVHHPESIRWRQFIPALLVPGLLVASVGMLLRGGYPWAALLAVYPAAILVGSAHAAATRKKWSTAGWIAGAFVTIHLAWSVAFWLSLAALGVSKHREPA